MYTYIYDLLKFVCDSAPSHYVIHLKNVCKNEFISISRTSLKLDMSKAYKLLRELNGDFAAKPKKGSARRRPKGPAKSRDNFNVTEEDTKHRGEIEALVVTEDEPLIKEAPRLEINAENFPTLGGVVTPKQEQWGTRDTKDLAMELKEKEDALRESEQKAREAAEIRRLHRAEIEEKEREEAERANASRARHVLIQHVTYERIVNTWIKEHEEDIHHFFENMHLNEEFEPQKFGHLMYRMSLH